MRKLTKINRKITALLLAGVMALVPVTQADAANAGNSIARGIDVSKHNGAVNWGSVAASGISFAFIKAGSTNSGVDPYFDANMRGAQAAGLKVGVYLYSYATTVEQAKNEADLLVGWLENYTVSFPVVYDVEDSCHKGLSQAQLQALIDTFCSTVAAAGYYPMVYSSKNWFNQRIGNVGYDKWVAQYADNLEYNGAAFWQNTSHGSVSGVGTRVDMNYQFKDFSTLIISDGFLDRNGQTLFFAGYKMQRGWINYNDTRYYLDGNGFLQRECWFVDESGTYYLQGDGSIARGQVNIADQGYYFDGNGVRLTGWMNLENGKFYYAPDTGAMQHGWFADESGTYYLSAGGDVTRGQAEIDAQQYYFDANGVRQGGWVTLENGKFYYAPDTGAMHHGWLDDNGARYYLSTQDGHMLVSDVTIDGQQYYFDENGVMQTGIVTKADEKQYFYNETGALVVDQQITIEDVLYQADANGNITPVPVEETQPEAEAQSAEGAEAAVQPAQ
ncbi:MAG: hypothetical protein NC434_05110 [Ruminococcus sp.]|nr:hypothetical protein [Ruminococcus sp.]